MFLSGRSDGFADKFECVEDERVYQIRVLRYTRIRRGEAVQVEEFSGPIA
jgi:hypothetical protein